MAKVYRREYKKISRTPEEQAAVDARRAAKKQEKEQAKLLESMPKTPDPLWPAGVKPLHIPKEKQSEFERLVGPIWHCTKCGRTIGQSIADNRYCNDCYKKEAQNTKLAQRVNSNWMEQAEELGLALFERQPEETDAEWRIWCKYREYYPHKLPTWQELAKACGVPIATVTRAAQKWSYKVRLIAWSQYTDSTIQEKRIEAIKEMNEKQLVMAKTIQEKLKTAIENLDPLTLRPNEVVNLFKVATELERKVTTYVDEKVNSELEGAKSKQVSLTRPEDLSEVVSILKKTGLLDGRTIGIEQTTRVVAKENDK